MEYFVREQMTSITISKFNQSARSHDLRARKKNAEYRSYNIQPLCSMVRGFRIPLEGSEAQDRE
jgi:hypothetical protein